MELHYKAEIWVAMKFPDDVTKEEIIERLETNELPSDLGNWYDVEYDPMYETEECISLEENDGQSTIEVMDTTKDGWGLECVWDNSYESEIKKLNNE